MKTKQIIAKKKKWRLVENKQNKRTSETLIVNAPSEGSNSTTPLLLLSLLLSFLWCFCVDFLRIRAKRKWNLRLADNEWNTRTAETIISKYAIIEFKRHILPAFAVAVAAVLFFVLFLCWLFGNKRQTKMKLKVSGEQTEQKNSGNDHHKYSIRGFTSHLPSTVAVASVILFLLLLRWLFQNKRQTKMKLKVRG